MAGQCPFLRKEVRTAEHAVDGPLTIDINHEQRISQATAKRVQRSSEATLLKLYSGREAFLGIPSVAESVKPACRQRPAENRWFVLECAETRWPVAEKSCSVWWLAKGSREMRRKSPGRWSPFSVVVTDRAFVLMLPINLRPPHEPFFSNRWMNP